MKESSSFIKKRWWAVLVSKALQNCKESKSYARNPSKLQVFAKGCISNTSTWKGEVKGLSCVQGHLGLHSEFQASLVKSENLSQNKPEN